MSEWMRTLADHYESIKQAYPHDKLIILFDIDGTILDMRYMILSVLRSCDRHHGTCYFKNLRIPDITIHESNMKKFIQEIVPEPQERHIINDWCMRHFWSTSAILESHRPFSGVMEVIRWFQIQPNTFVGLNTGRPDFIRRDTLHSLNRIGRQYKVHFDENLIFMNSDGWDSNIPQVKSAGIQFFRDAGYRVFAFIDNEPDNLGIVPDIDPDNEILLLHADTIFNSKRIRIPSNAISGTSYDITELITEDTIPSHIQFVWHGSNNSENLKQFFNSNVTWAEFTVCLDAMRESIILHDDVLDHVQRPYGEDCISLEELLIYFLDSKKSIKLDVKENGQLIDKLIELLRHFRFNDTRLWFSGKIEVLKENGFRTIAERFPGSILQCPIDYMAPLIESVPSRALSLLDTFSDWGINRFSLSWKTPNLHRVLDKLDTWGFEANIYNLPDLESFLKAVLLFPTSVTTDFTFLRWSQRNDHPVYYGDNHGHLPGAVSGSVNGVSDRHNGHNSPDIKTIQARSL
ncbi:MAG: hypothetical protein JW736_04945 [Deltaproteobacteria bacterium]|nr:hypothetical protein [Deltaproteobacteria bacterium]MBN2688042.1 hypothetical protein [Deltaproteobacteria bacterium]